MSTSILVVFNETPCANLAVEFLAQMPLRFSEVRITLMHFFRKPTGSEEMMGRKFMQTQQERIDTNLSNARQRLIECGYPPDNVHVHLETRPFPTVADGIIAELKKGRYDIVVIGRKKMSKSEEFVIGDASIKLVRALDHTTVIIVRC